MLLQYRICYSAIVPKTRMNSKPAMQNRSVKVSNWFSTRIFSSGVQITHGLKRCIRGDDLYKSAVITRTLRSHMILSMYVSNFDQLFWVWYLILNFYRFNCYPQTWDCVYLLLFRSIVFFIGDRIFCMRNIDNIVNLFLNWYWLVYARYLINSLLDY